MVDLNIFYNVLEEKEIIKIQEPVWKKIDVFHGKECLDHYKVKELKQLRVFFNDWHKIPGLYAYFDETTCIYIGVSKALRERIYQHMLESCGAWGHPRYREVFGRYKGLIQLYVLPIGDHSKEGDYLRSIIEKILQIRHKPYLMSTKI